MKTKWIWYDVLFYLIALVVTVGFQVLLIYLAYNEYAPRWDETILATRYLLIASLVGITAMPVFFLVRAFIYLRVIRFDEKGFYFYDITGLRCACTWESIEKAEYFRTIRAAGNDRRRYRPVCIAVYNKEHFLRPVLTQHFRLRNTDRNGWRFKINKQDSEVAIIVGIDSFSAFYFEKYFHYYRPDTAILQDVSMIEYE